MIQNSRQGNNLKEYVNSVPFIDTNETSKNYFRISKFPDRLYVGKNSFRISGNNDQLVLGSRIYIDVVDNNGNIIYHEVLNVISKDKSKIVVIHVYENTPSGEATVYIGGRLRKNPTTGEPIPYTDDPNSANNKDVPNVIWIGKTSVVIDSSNPSDLFYGKEPEIMFTERLVSYFEISGSTRRETISGSGQRLSITSQILPSQYSNDSKFEDSIVEEGKVFRRIPEITGNTGQYEGSIRIPEYAELTKIKSNQAIFSKTMEGGRIYVNSINVENSLPKGASVTIPDYSASIVRVVNNTTIEVDNPFNVKRSVTLSDGTVTDLNFDKFVNQATFSISYFNDNIARTETLVTESFANIEFTNIEPLGGTLDKINISYKSVGSFGNFRDVGQFKVEKQNYLVDSSVQKLTLAKGLVEKQIGFVENQSETDTYWTASGVGISGTSLVFSEDKITNAFEIDHSGSFDSSQYIIVTKTDFGQTTFSAKKNTEYTLEFDSNYEADPADTSSWTKPFLDVYISGSGVRSGEVNVNNSTAPLDDLTLGTYIGTVDSRYGKQRENKFSFITLDNKDIKPVFVIRSGKWTLGKISMSPRLERGYSPNHFKLNVPISDLQSRTELVFNFDYLTKDSKPANINSQVFGVKFKGASSFVSQSIVNISSSFEDRITILELSGSSPSGGVDWDDVNNKPTVVSSSAQIANDISGSLAEFSQSIVEQLGFRPTGSADNNQVLFWQNGITGSDSLIWDSSNSRLGVNTTPDYSFHLVGDLYVDGAIRDRNESTGSTGEVLTSTPTGLLWATASQSETQDLQDVTDNGFVTTNPIQADYVSSSYYLFSPLNDATAPPYQEGTVYYNTEHGALNVYNDIADEYMELGQEFYVRGINKSGTTISKGTPVRISGSQGDQPAFVPAVAEDIHTGSYKESYSNHIIGVAHHNIANGATGYVTEIGLVRGINTNGFTGGDTVFVDETGALTGTPPPYPYETIKVGYVTKVGNNGTIYVRPKEPIHIAELSQFSGSAEVGDVLVFTDNDVFEPTKTLSNITASGSFSGSFQGDGSGLTNITITVSGTDDEIFFRSGSQLTTDPIFLWQDQTLKVGDVHIKSESIGFQTKRLIIKNGNFEDLIITGSTQLRAIGGTNVLNIKNTLGNDTISVNPEGVFILQPYTNEPTAVQGGIMASGSELFFGV